MRDLPPTSRPHARALLALVVLLLVPVSVGTGVAGPSVPAGASTSVTPTIASGGSHTCELLSDGTVRCWGSNRSGQLGDGTTTDRPHRVTVVRSGSEGGGPLTGVTAIAAGGDHTCALLDGGTVLCWGENRSGELGITPTSAASDPRPHPVEVSGLTGVAATAITAGTGHTCAVLDDGTAACWGNNEYGQLGIGASGPTQNPTPTRVSLGGRVVLADVQRISAGSRHTCATVAVGGDDVAACWGDNSDRQLGDGTSAAVREHPVEVVDAGGGPLRGTITSISAGEGHTCVTVGTGSTTIRCWGANGAGQLGDGTTTSSGVPVVVTGVTDASAVAAGGAHTCAVRTGGAVSCWGTNSLGPSAFGQLGDGTGVNRSSPVAVRLAGTSGTTLTGVTSVALGTQHTCALVGTDVARCWGRNQVGQVGLGRAFDSSAGDPSGVLNPATVRSAADPSGVLAVPAPACSARFSTTAAMDGPFERLTAPAEFWVEVTFDRPALVDWVSALTTSSAGGPLETLWGIDPATDLRLVHTLLSVRAVDAAPLAPSGSGTGPAVDPAVVLDAPMAVGLLRGVFGPDADDVGLDVARLAVAPYLRGISAGTIDDYPSRFDDVFASSPRVVRVQEADLVAALDAWGLAAIDEDAPFRPEVVLSMRLATDGPPYDLAGFLVLPCGGPATLVTSEGPTPVPAQPGPAPAGPTVTCTPDTLTVGTEVACAVTGGDAGIDVLWRATVNPTIAEGSVTLDGDGRGAFGFTVPASALGRAVDVELVGWAAPVTIGGGASVGGAGGPVPSAVPAGEGGGAAPGGLLTLLGAVALVGITASVLLGRRTRAAA